MTHVLAPQHKNRHLWNRYKVKAGPELPSIDGIPGLRTPNIAAPARHVICVLAGRGFAQPGEKSAQRDDPQEGFQTTNRGLQQP